MGHPTPIPLEIQTARRPRASVHSLGCRVNQAEAREAAAELQRMGYEIVPFGRPADVCIVNTCSVTDQADAKSRAAVRRARRGGDDPLIIATGCYAEIAPEEVAALPGVAAVVPNREKPRLAEIADDVLRRSGRLLFPLDEAPGPASRDEPAPLRLALEGCAGRTRAVVKIQDGCNHFCSFCIIPFARGRLRSRPPDEVLAEARELARLGYRELVLAGICLGDYGDEKGSTRSERDPLARLLEELAAIPGIERLRLSSIDPADTSQDLIETMARLPQVCRHLHLSLQSGDEEVLLRMRRRYTAAGFRDLVRRIRAAMPDAGLTCDVIAGFPGESLEQFAGTLRLCEESEFCRIHAFPYSPRSGTLAARWADDVPPAEKQRRVRLLTELSDRLARSFAEAHVGRTVRVLVEQRDRTTGRLSGLTGNYLRVNLDGPDTLRGQLVDVRVLTASPGGVDGERVAPAAHRSPPGRTTDELPVLPDRGR